MKYIKGYEGLYKVSKNGEVFSCKTNKFLKPGKSTRGYLGVSLYKDKEKKRIDIHRLVAITYLKKDENKNEVNHINGNKIDNRLENLEWCNRAENERHAYKTGLKSKKGENHHMCKLKESDVIKIRELREEGKTQVALAEMFNVNRRTIRGVIDRKTWKHI